MNHLTLLAAFKLCVLTHGRKSGLFEIRADHVTCLARDLFHSPPDPLCPTSPGAWNLEAESPWLESAERKSSPAWAKTCLVTASLFVKWDQLIVAQRAFKALGWGWWSLCKWLSVQRPWTLNFRHAGTFWACRQSLWCALFDQTIAGKNWLHFRHPPLTWIQPHSCSRVLHVQFPLPGHPSPGRPSFRIPAICSCVSFSPSSLCRA